MAQQGVTLWRYKGLANVKPWQFRKCVTAQIVQPPTSASPFSTLHLAVDIFHNTHDAAIQNYNHQSVVSGFTSILSMVGLMESSSATQLHNLTVIDNSTKLPIRGQRKRILSTSCSRCHHRLPPLRWAPSNLYIMISSQSFLAYLSSCD